MVTGKRYVAPRNETGSVPESCRRSADVPFSYANHNYQTRSMSINVRMKLTIDFCLWTQGGIMRQCLRCIIVCAVDILVLLVPVRH